MSRIIKEDFLTLKKYLVDYKIDHANKATFIGIAQPTHKCFLALAALLGEIIHQHDKQQLCETERKYLEEVSSNIGEAFFCLIHGAYKPSRMMMRSSIEVFLKFWLYASDNRILEEKFVYKIFDAADNDAILKNVLCSSELDQIKDSYSKLCRSVHSATLDDLSSIGSLAYFPVFDNKEGKKCAISLQNLIKNYCNILCFRYSDCFNAAHHTNRAIISAMLKTDIKRRVLGE